MRQSHIVTLQPGCETPAQNCITMQVSLIMKEEEEEWWWGHSNYQCFSAGFWDVNEALWVPGVTHIRWLQCLTLTCCSSTAQRFGPVFYLLYFFFIVTFITAASLQCRSQAQGPNRGQVKTHTHTQFSSYIGSIGVIGESVHILKPKCIAGVVGSMFTVCSSASLHYIYPGGEPQDVLGCHSNTKLAHCPYIVQRYWSKCHRKVQYINSTVNHQQGYNINNDNCFVFLCQLVFKGQKNYLQEKKTVTRKKYLKSLDLVFEAWFTKVLFMLNAEIVTFCAQVALKRAETASFSRSSDKHLWSRNMKNVHTVGEAKVGTTFNCTGSWSGGELGSSSSRRWVGVVQRSDCPAGSRCSPSGRWCFCANWAELPAASHPLPAHRSLLLVSLWSLEDAAG